jgi:hypothetical protein
MSPLTGTGDTAGGLDWPLALRILPPGPEVRALRQQIEARAQEVERQAKSGQVSPALVRQLSQDVDALGDILADRAASLPVSQQAIADAGRFIQKLRDTIKTLY